MNVQEMHYDFKMKLNKIDSQQYRNLLVPEIDWLLNSATEMFIKMTTMPRYNPVPGFEKTKRDMEDIKGLVVNNLEIDSIIDDTYPTQYICSLPENYLYFVSAKVLMENNNCGLRIGTFKVRQHDDNFEISPFDKSSYNWGIVNGTFFENGIRLYTDDTFSIKKLILNYIKKYPYIHFADGFYNHTYTNLKNIVLTGTQDCILSEHTHSEIVDIAILLATQSLQMPDYSIKLNKLKLT